MPQNPESQRTHYKKQSQRWKQWTNFTSLGHSSAQSFTIWLKNMPQVCMLDRTSMWFSLFYKWLLANKNLVHLRGSKHTSMFPKQLTIDWLWTWTAFFFTVAVKAGNSEIPHLDFMNDKATYFALGIGRVVNCVFHSWELRSQSYLAKFWPLWLECWYTLAHQGKVLGWFLFYFQINWLWNIVMKQSRVNILSMLTEWIFPTSVTIKCHLP